MSTTSTPVCEHGAPSRALTSGLPACPLCRRLVLARREAQRQAAEARARRARDVVDVAALAANDDTLDLDLDETTTSRPHP